MFNFHFSTFTAAVLIGWIFSVCVHEFAHAAVAYLGGDKSDRTRGYLKFNPLDYIDPMMSIMLPSIILIMGGMPLPGGAVYIDDSMIRSRAWRSAVSAAGPASNIILFIVLAIAVHPAVGLVGTDPAGYAIWERFLGVLVVLQMFGIFINLIPIPPLDGFGIIRPFMRYEDQMRFREPVYAYGGMFILFFVVFRFEPIMDGFWSAATTITDAIGLDRNLLYGSYNLAFIGSV
jgi:Zn-dependent protease